MTFAKRFRTAAMTAFHYALAGLGGYVASLSHVPLAWVLGALAVTATLSLSGVRVNAPVNLRRGGQLIIGATVGLSMTSDVVAGLVAWLPMMIFTAFFSVFGSATACVIYAHLGRLDVKSAFFALMPGGLVEMGNIGASIGAHAEPIAIIQSMRVAIVVCIIPPLMMAHELHAASRIPLGPALPLEMVAVVMVAGLCGVVAAFFARVNNPWMVGALVGVGVLTACGLVEGHMPLPIFWLGQVVLGYNIGARFKRESIRRLPRIAGAGAVMVVGLMAFMALYAWIMSHIVPLDFPTGVLVSSPGGTAEMAATAQALHLAVALVTAFHMVRATLVNGFATFYWRVFQVTGYRRLLERVLGKAAVPDMMPPTI